MFSRFFLRTPAKHEGAEQANKLSASLSCSQSDNSDVSNDSDDDSMGISFEPPSSRAIVSRARTVPVLCGHVGAIDPCDNNPLSRFPTPRLIHRGKHADILLARDLETSSMVVLKAFPLAVGGRSTGRATAAQARHEQALLHSLASAVSYAEGAFSDSSSCSADTCAADPTSSSRSWNNGNMRSAPMPGVSSYSCSAPRSHASSSARFGDASSSGLVASGSCTVGMPAIAQTVHTFATDQQMFTVLECCPGVTMIELIANRGGRLSELMCVEEVVHPLLVTLAALHAAGVAHRQVQPEHVLCHQGEARLIDFLHAADKATQRLIQRVGTLEYMAPEVINKLSPDEIFLQVLELGMSEDELPAYDERCDVWSLGVMVYEALTGCQPFIGDTAAEVAAAQVAALEDYDGHAVPEIIARHIRLSSAAQDFLCQSLHLEPSGRASAAKLLLHPWLQQLMTVQPAKPAAPHHKRSSGKLKTFLRSCSAMS